MLIYGERDSLVSVISRWIETSGWTDPTTDADLAWWSAVDVAVRHAETLAGTQTRHVLAARWRWTKVRWTVFDVAALFATTTDRRARTVRHVVLESLDRKSNASSVPAAAHRDHVSLDAARHELSLLIVADVEDVVDLLRCQPLYFWIEGVLRLTR